ncbi:glycosyltransferase [Clostridium paraputrificum]|uniref:glycosyltransferase n=1 Tax=Clostridium paraputrificum TaxID=29363 RepID=UPI00189D4659|nr:glycosyltransferase [Clostridium paraputrificum]MDB2116094.1 glycosyltransferase [Clostridium paraputrificum]
MKKILIIITTGFDSCGGLTTVAMNYIRNIDRSNLSIEFCSDNSPDKKLLNELQKNNIKYHQLSSRKKNTIMYYLNLVNLIKRNMYDVIHVHGNSSTMIIELFAAKVCKVKKRIAQVHSSQTSHPILNKMLYLPFKFCYTDAIAVSKQAGDWLFGRDNYTVLNNAIYLNKYKYDEKGRSKIRKKYKIADDEVVIGNVGKLNGGKNHKFLLQIYKEYLIYNPSSKLIIVGGGTLKNELKNIAQKEKIESKVIFADMQTNVEEYLSAMDCFVFTSIYEGLGMALIEAQASGLYCISSDRVPIETSVTSNIQYLKLNNNIKAWANAILNCPKINRDDINILNEITENGFDIKVEANKLVKLYLE